jgi:hypothetical protein
MEGNFQVYSNSELADMHLMYGLGRCNSTAARRLYQENFPNRRCPSARFFSTIHQRLSETGSLKSSEHSNAGIARLCRTAELEELVLNEISDHPEKSTRELSLQFNVSQTSIWRILHEYQLHPYHIQQVHTLLPQDYAPRVAFCRWFLEKCVDPNFLTTILFTDEAHFTRTAIVNFHNKHIWADMNPHAIKPNRPQHQFSVNVWAGIFADDLFVFMLPPRLNGMVYLNFLREELPDLLDDVPLQLRQNMWFMHDGAPAHYSVAVREHLNESFPNQWIGRGGPVPWPARSPDLNPLDFYLWGHLKTLVYSSPIDTIEELCLKISNGIETIKQTPGVFERVRNSMRRRLNACILNNGGHFEHQL